MNKEKINALTYKAGLYLNEHSTTILSSIAVVGLFGTTVTAVKATPKAVDILKTKEEEKGEELDVSEKIKAVGKLYIPSIVLGIGTVGCIFGANVLNKKKQASLTSAYMMLENSYKEYRNKVNELYGNEADSKVKEAIVKDKYTDEGLTLEGDKRLFYEPLSDRYFETTIEKIQYAEYHFNRNFILRDYAKLNEFYRFLGLEETELGEVLGWSTYMGHVKYGYSWVDFKHPKTILEDGLECYSIEYPFEPALDFMEY